MSPITSSRLARKLSFVVGLVALAAPAFAAIPQVERDALIALYGRDQDRTDDLEDELVGDALCDEVKSALDRLGPEYRDVVERADLKGEKYKDIADALRVPIGTVMSRLFRARRVLETELAGYAAKEHGIRRAA